MRAGRKPTATELHKLRGTFRATRHRDREGEPQPNGRLSATPPKWLSEAQGELWTHAVTHAPPDLLRLIDGECLAVWCVAAALHRAAVQEQEQVALSPDGKTMSPYLKIADIAGARMLRAAGELGFSPSSRPRLSSGAKTKAETEVDDFWSRFALPADVP
jgi:P27 family predicted phage terminase small subunit